MTHEMSRFILVEAPVEKVWAALTSPNELTRWFCRKASVDLKEGGTYQIDTNVPLGSGIHRLTQVHVPQLLRFQWMIENEPTEASIRLEDFRGLTRVTAKHVIPDSFSKMNAITDSLGNAPAGLEYLWGYVFLLLKSYLRDPSTQFRIEGESNPLHIEWESAIAASPEDVFKALIDPEKIKKWNPYAGEIRIDPREGGRYSFGWPMEDQGTDGPDHIVEYKDGHKVVYTWHGQDPKTLVSWTVTPDGSSGTKLHFTHSGFLKNPKAVLEYKLGWAGFLYAVKMLAETGQGMNEWYGHAEGDSAKHTS